jgi:hypothetical protein
MGTRAAALLSILIGCGQGVSAVADAAVARQLDFDVFLDDRPIGYQRFALVPVGDGLRIETRAEFEVKVLGFTAFEYFHRNVEQWRGRCLQSIESSTDSNGEVFRVSGRVDDDGFRVAGDSDEQRLRGCVASFAYWDKSQLLGREQLLNPQTGEHVAVEVVPVGKRPLRLGEHEYEAEQYALRGKDIDIVLTYASRSGEWLALESRLDGGRVLRYLRSGGGGRGSLAAASPGV